MSFVTADLGTQTPAIDDRQQIDDADLAVAVDVAGALVGTSRGRTGRTVSGIGPDDAEAVVVGGPDTESLNTAGPDDDPLTIIRNTVGWIGISRSTENLTGIRNAILITVGQ